jgi:hypothetical protein
VCLKFGHTAT